MREEEIKRVREEMGRMWEMLNQLACLCNEMSLIIRKLAEEVYKDENVRRFY